MTGASFTQKIAQQRGGEIRFLTAVEDGELCWFYLRVALDRLPEYERSLKSGDFNVRDFGTILESDWGDYPPEDVIRFMREEYGFVTPAPEL